MIDPARCDDCGGPAFWKAGPSGEIWYSCQASCEGFMVDALFSKSDAQPPLAERAPVAQVDRSGSVSAMVEVEVDARTDYFARKVFLPFLPSQLEVDDG